MKILIIGSGGREHALTHTFARQGCRVWCYPGNAGTEALAETSSKPKSLKHDDLIAFVQEQQIDLTVVGPEQPLSEGIADAFAAKGLKLFGPTAKAAKLEADKAWSKQFMQRHQIPTASYEVCHNSQEALKTIERHFNTWGGVVVKPAGLTAGKGVICCKTKQEANNAIKAIMQEKRFGPAGEVVVIEELLEGKELSLLAFCDGKTIIPMIPSQDHKKLGEADEGPNTGGIGAYAPTPFVSDQMLHEINELVVNRTKDGLLKEGIDYRGVLYFGLMLTQKGPRVLEYNCRFGDPETQVILPLLKSDLAQVMLSCINGTLSKVEWFPKSACCVVMVAEGYPFTYPTGDTITGLDQVENDVMIFHSGTKKNNGNIVTSGGRVLGVTGVGNTLPEAVRKAYTGVENIDFVSAYYRKDIAYQALELQR